jgi:hypothetical protein
MLNELALCEELFHTPSGVAFADFITDGHGYSSQPPRRTLKPDYAEAFLNRGIAAIARS